MRPYTWSCSGHSWFLRSLLWWDSYRKWTGRISRSCLDHKTLDMSWACWILFGAAACSCWSSYITVLADTHTAQSLSSVWLTQSDWFPINMCSHNTFEQFKLPWMVNSGQWMIVLLTRRFGPQSDLLWASVFTRSQAAAAWTALWTNQYIF